MSNCIEQYGPIVMPDEDPDAYIAHRDECAVIQTYINESMETFLDQGDWSGLHAKEKELAERRARESSRKAKRPEVELELGEQVDWADKRIQSYRKGVSVLPKNCDDHNADCY